MLRTATLVTLMLALAACSFESAAPPGTLIACKVDADCPPEFVCVLEIARCVAVADRDSEAPALVAPPTIEPAVVPLGGQVVVRFAVTEALLQDPLVVIQAADRPRPLVLDEAETSRGALTYGYRYVLSGDEVEGASNLTVDLVDLGGSVARGLAAGRVVFDFTPPSVAAVLFTSPVARAGIEVGLTLTLAEPSAAPPPVLLAPAGVATLPFTSTGGDPDGLVFTYTLQVAGTEPEGAHPLQVQLTDLAGNEASVEPAVLGLDFTPPAIAAPGAQVDPAGPQPEQLVTVVLALTEPVASTPLLVGSRGNLEVTFAEGTTAGDERTFYRVFSGAEEGPWTLTLRDVVDAAGNLTPGDLPAGAIVVDGEPPALIDFALNGDVFSAIPGHHTVVATFSTSEPIDVPGAALSATAAELPMSCVEDASVQDLWSCSVTFDGTEPEGAAQVVIDLRDGSGNGTVLRTAIRLDFTPPRLVSAGVLPGAARLGDVLAAHLNTDEPLAAPPVLTVSGPSTISFAYEPGTSFTWTAPITGAESEGAYTVSAELEDPVGNVASSVGAGSFRLDLTSPGIQNLATDRTLYSLRPGFDVVTATFELTEDVPLESLVVGLGGQPMTCVRPDPAARRYRCTRSLTGAEGEGTRDVTVEVRDTAGNSSSDRISIVLDFTAPRLLGTRASPDAARAGESILYTVTVSEPLSSPPTVVTSGAGVLSLVYEQGTEWVFRYDVLGTEAEGEYLVDVTVDDIAGNLATAAGVSFAIDVREPQVTNLLRTSGTYSARPGFDVVGVGFDLSEELPAGGLAVTVGAEVMTCVRPDPGQLHYDCSYQITGIEPAGTQPILVSAEDRAGNRTAATELVVFDFSGPAVIAGSVAVQLLPAPGSRIAAVGRLGIDATARLSFGLDEQTLLEPVVEATAPAQLPFSLVNAASSVYLFEHTLSPGAYPQGSYSVDVSAIDVVGNPATTTLTLPAPGLLVDTVAPAIPDVVTAGRLVYGRMPWGSVATGGLRHFELRSLAGAVEAGSTAIAYEGPVASPAAELARAEADGAGTFGTLLLPRADRPEIYLAAVDAAGNGSAPVRIRDVEWTASFGGKVAGSSVENPHGLGEVAVTGESLTQLDPVEPASYGPLQAPDASSLLTTARRAWVARQLSGTSPTARTNHNMAFDRARGVVVLFGGFGTGLAETWEFDGQRWTEIAPQGPRPPPRQTHVLFYDPIRARVVLFGGVDGFGIDFLRDTWEWNGTSWVEVNVGEIAPPGRVFGSAVWDDVNGNAVLFGGRDQNDFALNDLWLWDGRSWQQIPAAGAWPGARLAASLAYDRPRGRVVLYGGVDAFSYLNDLWEWNGSSWSQRAPPLPRPSARASATLVGDPSRGKVVLHGGDNGASKFDDTWEWNGTTWTQLFLTPRPAGRTSGAGVYDEARRRVTLFGGDGAAGYLADTWQLDGLAWVPLSQTAAPPGRLWSALAGVDHLGTVLLFGGYPPAGGALADSWEWNGSLWTQRLGAGPPARFAHALAYDSVRRKVVLFGGADAGGNPIGDTWEWDAAGWVQRSAGGAGTPGVRYGHAMAYDVARGQVVLHGGYGAAGQSGDSWAWNGAAWSQLVPAGPGPSARDFSAMAYDPGRQRVVLFGGRDEVAGLDLSDTWEWNGVSWTELPIAGTRPAGRMQHRLSYAGRGEVVLFGGAVDVVTRNDDSWSFDGTAWTELDPPGLSPQQRDSHAMAYDSTRGNVLLFGGAPDPVARESWELDGGLTTRAGVAARIDWAIAQADASTVTSLSLDVHAGGSGFPVGGGAEIPGFDVAAWDDPAGGFVPLSSSLAGPAAPSLASWQSPDPATARRYLAGAGGGLHLLVRPAQSGGAGPTPSTLALDYVEVLVRYRLP